MDPNLFIPCSAEEELASIAAPLCTSYFGDHKVDYSPLHCIALEVCNPQGSMQSLCCRSLDVLTAPCWRSGEGRRSSMSEGITLQGGALRTIPLDEL